MISSSDEKFIRRKFLIKEVKKMSDLFNTKNRDIKKPAAADTKLVQASIPADIAEEFNIVAVKLGKKKKDIIEGMIIKSISDFNKGELTYV